MARRKRKVHANFNQGQGNRKRTSPVRPGYNQPIGHIGASGTLNPYIALSNTTSIMDEHNQLYYPTGYTLLAPNSSISGNSNFDDHIPNRSKSGGRPVLYHSAVRDEPLSTGREMPTFPHLHDQSRGDNGESHHIQEGFNIPYSVGNDKDALQNYFMDNPGLFEEYIRIMNNGPRSEHRYSLTPVQPRQQGSGGNRSPFTDRCNLYTDDGNYQLITDYHQTDSSKWIDCDNSDDYTSGNYYQDQVHGWSNNNDVCLYWNGSSDNPSVRLASMYGTTCGDFSDGIGNQDISDALSCNEGNGEYDSDCSMGNSWADDGISTCTYGLTGNYINEVDDGSVYPRQYQVRGEIGHGCNPGYDSDNTFQYAGYECCYGCGGIDGWDSDGGDCAGSQYDKCGYRDRVWCSGYGGGIFPQYQCRGRVAYFRMGGVGEAYNQDCDEGGSCGSGCCGCSGHCSGTDTDGWEWQDPDVCWNCTYYGDKIFVTEAYDFIGVGCIDPIANNYNPNAMFDGVAYNAGHNAFRPPYPTDGEDGVYGVDHECTYNYYCNLDLIGPHPDIFGNCRDGNPTPNFCPFGDPNGTGGYSACNVSGLGLHDFDECIFPDNYCRDADGDGYGDSNNQLLACDISQIQSWDPFYSYVTNCDDSNDFDSDSECTPEAESVTCGNCDCGDRTNNCGDIISCGVCDGDDFCHYNCFCTEYYDQCQCIGGGQDCTPSYVTDDWNTCSNCNEEECGHPMACDGCEWVVEWDGTTCDSEGKMCCQTLTVHVNGVGIGHHYGCKTEYNCINHGHPDHSGSVVGPEMCASYWSRPNCNCGGPGGTCPAGFKCDHGYGTHPGCDTDEYYDYGQGAGECYCTGVSPQCKVVGSGYTAKTGICVSQGSESGNGLCSF